MLRLEDVTLTVGTRDLLVGADLHLHPGEKVGLVGRNGSGKTSLLRAIVREIPIDEGKIAIRGDVVVGWLPQTAVSGSTRTVWDEARSKMATIDGLQKRVDSAQAAIERGEEDAIERFAEATEAFRIAGGFAVDERIGEVLHGLGFGPDTWTRGCETFSGGWQMRIALARTLLADPTLLLLDEPTNHLDLAARSWLSRWLERSPHAVIVVSHDRWLLDRVCTRIVEVVSGGLETYPGNFTRYLVERERRREERAVAFSSQQDEIARLQRFIDRFKATATKAAAAQSRAKRLDKIDRLEAPEREPVPRLRLPSSRHVVHEAITLKKATIGHKGEPDLVLARDVDLIVERGMRLAILGPNGAGKSTLLHALAGGVTLLAGQRRLGKDVLVGLFSQDLAQALPHDSSGLDYVLSTAPLANPGQARGALGALGLRGDMALREIGRLSGGEKARVALAAFALRAYDVLLLDEPTNHLDAVTVDVLVEALAGFDGSIVVVTHDRYVVEKLATHVARVIDGRVEFKVGLGPEDFEAGAIRNRVVDAGSGIGAGDHADRKQKNRDRTKAERRIAKIGERLSAIEVQIAALDERAFTETTWEASKKLADQRAVLEAESATLYAEWESLEG